MTEPNQPFPTRFPPGESCDLVSHLLSPYVDGLLTAQVRDAVAEHLATCAPCSEQLGSLERLLGTLATLPPVELGAGFDEGVARRLDQVQRRMGVAGAGSLLVAGFAAACLLVGAGWWLGTHRGDSGDGAPPWLASGSPAAAPASSDSPDSRGSGRAEGAGIEETVAADPGASRGSAGVPDVAGAPDGAVTPAWTGSDRPPASPRGELVATGAPEDPDPAATAAVVPGGAGGVRGDGDGDGDGEPGLEVRLAEPPPGVVVEEGQETMVAWGAGRHLARATAAVEDGDLARAEKEFTRAIRQRRWAFPDELEQAYLGRGQVLLRAGRDEAAVRDFREILRLVAGYALPPADSLELADTATDSICEYLGIAVRVPPVGPVDRLTDTQLCRFVGELRRRLPVECRLDGDPEVAVGRVEVSQVGLAEIALEKIGRDLRTFMVRYPDHFEIQQLTLEDR